MTPHFGWRELYAGNRFLAPVSEAALLEAGRAAGLSEGATVLDLACGNGAASIFLAEEFHVYARGIDAAADLIASAQAHAERSRAGRRVRFFHEDAANPDAGHGPVDFACALRGGEDVPVALLRAGGRCILGRYVLARDPAPAELAEHFPIDAAPPEAEILWGREATPLEWERFFAPQERALRVYRRELANGDPVNPLALDIDRRIRAFRRFSACLAYRLLVVER